MQILPVKDSDYTKYIAIIDDVIVFKIQHEDAHWVARDYHSNVEDSNCFRHDLFEILKTKYDECKIFEVKEV